MPKDQSDGPGGGLFSPLGLREVVFPNRIVVSPMCQYSSLEGHAADWHLVHLGSRAVGGAGCVFTEAAAVSAAGRISPADLGIWLDDHIAGLARIARFLKASGSVPGIQLAHAGRKASTQVPWRGREAVAPGDGGWTPLAPSAEPFVRGRPVPHALDGSQIAAVAREWGAAAERSLRAGFEVVELHFAHGYLVHQFLSPLSNRRTDDYGGSFENRIRFALAIVHAVREAWPGHLPLFVRLSATDWIEGGWTADDTVELARRLVRAGVDLIDCSSGGVVGESVGSPSPGWQVPFAERVRSQAGIASGAVGLITGFEQADAIVREGRADLVFLARAMLRDPHWSAHAAQALDVDRPWPAQYQRAIGSRPGTRNMA